MQKRESRVGRNMNKTIPSTAGRTNRHSSLPKVLRYPLRQINAGRCRQKADFPASPEVRTKKVRILDFLGKPFDWFLRLNSWGQVGVGECAGTRLEVT